MSGVFLLLVMAGPGPNQVPSAMNQGPLENKTVTNKLLDYCFILLAPMT